MRSLIAKLAFIAFVAGLLPAGAGAESEAIALSITPPLIKANIAPGQIWQSTVKVVNNNTEEITVYVQALDFRSGAEDGSVAFIRPTGAEDEADYLLSRWIDLPEESLAIAPAKSREVPFVVQAPETAAPGGHYAAILVGTRPPEGEISGASIKVSSLVACLLMLNVAGAVEEAGSIREFSTDRAVYGEGRANFKVRFENLGNVHVQPQGEIRIFDMYNDSAAAIKINHSTEFGNVLPQSTRSWEFAWEDDISLLDAGRYRAELVMSYGQEGRQTLSQTRYFWILPYRPLAAAAAALAFLLALVYLLVRRSVRKAIRESERLAGVVRPEDRPASGITILPRDNGDGKAAIVDLKSRPSQPVQPARRRPLGWRGFRRLAIAVIAIAGLAGAAFLLGPLGYWPAPVPADVPDAPATDAPAEPAAASVTSDPGEPETADEAEPALYSAGAIEPVRPSVAVLNGSGAPGAGGRAEALLKAGGWEISGLGNADNFDYDRTVILYPADLGGLAEEIRAVFPAGAALEADESLGAGEVVVIIGKDFE